MDTLLPRLRNEHERSIRYFKEEIEEHGYKIIRELFEMFKQNPYLNEEYRYKLAILLSIARWEFQYETKRDPSDDANALAIAGTCALCMYHTKVGNVICDPQGAEWCILFENSKDSCCWEWRGSEQDKGKSLIIRMRREFNQKYYRKFKYYKNGEEIMKEEQVKELEDLIDKERELSHKTKLRIARGDPTRIMTRSELFIRIKLEELITEREGMVAENKQRESRGSSMAYIESNFTCIQEQMEELVEELED